MDIRNSRKRYFWVVLLNGW